MMLDLGSRLVLASIMVAASPVLTTGNAIQAESGATTAPATDTDGKSSTPSPVDDDAVRPGRPFALAVGETVILADGLSVSFTSLVGDSRCPADVTCVWEGNAEIAIDIAIPDAGDGASLRLNTNPSFATVATYRSYSIGLIGLEPYPRTDVETSEPYRATLVVCKTPAHPTPTPSTSGNSGEGSSRSV